MNREIEAGEILPLFLHNIRSSGNEDIVIPIRGESSVVLPSLGREKFQIVFVDGDHRYDAVLSISSSVRNCGPGRCVVWCTIWNCNPSRSIWQRRTHERMRITSKTQNRPVLPPGVTLAVGQSFNSVSVWEDSGGSQDFVRMAKGGIAKLVGQRHSAPSAASFVHIFNDLVEYFKRLGLI